MQVGGAGNIVSDATFTAALEQLQDTLIALQATIDDGVPLLPTDIAQLQQVTATVMGMPTDYPDSAGTAVLNDIKAELAGLLSVAVSNFPADYPDAAALTQLEDANTALTSILGEVGDNGTLLTDIDSKLGGTLTVTVTGEVEVKNDSGNPLPVTASVSNFPSDYPDAGTHTKLDTVHTDLGHITDGTAKTQIYDGTNVIGTSTHPVRVDPTGVTVQPVSGTTTANQGTPAAVASSWPVEITDGTNVLGVTAHPIRTDPTGTTTQPVSGTGTFLVDGSGHTQPVSGTVSTTPPSHASTNVDQLNGTTIDTNSGNKSAGTQRVVIATDQPSLNNALPVSAASLPLPTGAATDSSLTTLHTDLGHLTDGTQQSKITDGTQIANTLAGDSGQNSLLIAGNRKEVTLTMSGSASSAIDCSNYRWISAHVTAHTSSTLTWQGSNDGTNWTSVVLVDAAAASGVGGGISSTVTGTTVGIFHGPIVYRYFRVNQGAGTATIVVELFSQPAATFQVGASSGPGTLSVSASQAGTWTVQPGNTANTTAWLVTDRGSTATVTSPALSTASATLIAAAATRKEVIISNRTGQILYVRFGAAAASSTDYTLKLAVDDVHIEDKYTGAMTAIMATGTGNAQVTEIT